MDKRFYPWDRKLLREGWTGRPAKFCIFLDTTNICDPKRRRERMTKKRVIAFGSGYLGKHGIRKIIEHPDLELVGLRVWSADKVGSDAGTIAETDAVGLAATDDVDALLALKADCVAYFASTVGRDEDALADVLPFLKAGTNVVSISHFDAQYPDFGDPALVAPLQDACMAGGSSFLLTGEEPGFAFGQFLFTLLSTFGRVDSVEVREMSMVQNYAGRDSLLVYGFNGPTDVKPKMFTDQVGASWHIATLKGICAYLGLEVDEVTQSWDSLSSDHPVTTAAFGVVEPGRVTATRWTVRAHVRGKPFLTYQKILRLEPAVGQEWATSKLSEEPGVVHQIQIEGDVALSTEVFRPKRGLSATPTIAVNAVPFVCAAAPGILRQHDLALFPPASAAP
jgi:4-hydroxy-tetrahydrodipicolinate reductase